MKYKTTFKFLVDFSIAFITLIILSPVFLIVTVLLFLANKGNPFFFQERPGKNRRVFRIIKFKTMKDIRDAEGELLPDEARLTSVGKFIRSTSMDEIPQLMNVLKGDMSLIGPRPLLVKYLPLYTKEQDRRHEVRPGITGWAQVNGRNAISWKKKFEYDVWYVDNMSFIMDMAILWITLKKVLKRSGISSRTASTMEEFKGSKRIK